jgi:transposase
VTHIDVVSQYQEDLPPVRPLVREFQIEVGHCAACGRRVQGRHPLQTSDAVGAAAVQLGPQAISLATVLHTQLGVPVGKVATLFDQTFQLAVTPGGIIRALHRLAVRAEPTYEALITAVRESSCVVPDETGWRENGHPRWLWVYATPTTTVYRITPGRSFADATRVLPATYAGALTRDGWVAYRDYTDAGHQSCLRHLLRRCELLVTDHPHSRFAPQVQTLLQAALAVRDRRAAGTISDHGVAVARGRLAHQLNRLLESPGRVPAVQRFARHLDREFPYLFSFLYDPTVDATNWRAEQAIRPAVAIRKVCGGNRSARGLQTQYVLASLLRTAVQRQVAIPATIARLLRSARPIVPKGFRVPP